MQQDSVHDFQLRQLLCSSSNGPDATQASVLSSARLLSYRYIFDFNRILCNILQVRYVEDITATQRVERELALFKVSAPPGAARTEVVQLADMFRARIVDVSGELKSGSETLIQHAPRPTPHPEMMHAQLQAAEHISVSG